MVAKLLASFTAIELNVDKKLEPQNESAETREIHIMNRRDVLGLAVSAGAASALLPGTSFAQDKTQSAKFRIVDSNVSLFHWPFRRLPLDETTKLVAKLKSLGIAQAWAGSFEAVLHRDITSVNQRLADECSKHAELTPIGSINLSLPDWQGDLRRCVDQHKMPGIRLYPSYHDYKLDDARFLSLVEKATRAGRFIQIASTLEDVRTQHPMVRVPDVDLSPLPDIAKKVPLARIQILNHRLRAPLLDVLAQVPGIYFDTARVDSTDGVPKLAKSVSADCVLFGSHAPFLIPESALIRVHESGTIPIATMKAVLAGNADQLRKASR
jgi:predicted TIM-barrel fold metal-dependent hydrolase